MKKINVILSLILTLIIVSFIILIIIKSIKSKTINYPYFVATKIDIINIRSGPGTDYPVLLTYRTLNMPLKVLDNHEKWLHVENFNGVVGWVFKPLTKDKKSALIIVNTTIYKERNIANLKENIIALIKINNLVEIVKCYEDICKIKHKTPTTNLSGWVKKTDMWGATD